MVLKEFDGGKAVIEPSAIIEKLEGMPKSCIGVFSKAAFKEWTEKYSKGIIVKLNSIVGVTDVHIMEIDGHEFAFFMPWLGGPAAVGQMEELIGNGCENFVIYGSAGVLRHDIADGHLIVPTAAIRDEGTSYHYAPPSDEIAIDSKLVKLAEDCMKDLGLPFVGGKTWTTDAFFRETPKKVEAAKSMGAICVDMECASLAAAAQFRKANFVQFLWSGDNLDAPEWDRRTQGEHDSTRTDKCMTAAIEISKRMSNLE